MSINTFHRSISELGSALNRVLSGEKLPSRSLLCPVSGFELLRLLRAGR